jgi:Carbohydrate-selective porin, OprB family
MAFNGISASARSYFAAGGLGMLVGDGQLPHPGGESILETFYSLHLIEHFTISPSFQYVIHPAYNRDRGPVSIFAMRVHAEFLAPDWDFAFGVHCQRQHLDRIASALRQLAGVVFVQIPRSDPVN